MLILAFDTTNEFGGAGLYDDAKCLGELPNPARQGGSARGSYSVTLFEIVEKLLKSNGRALGDVQLFAVANGPGSFTGIRVGIAAAQGWAVALGRPVAGISVLEAMVEAARPETDFAAALLDARRGEFFTGVYTKGGGANNRHFMPTAEGVALKPENVPPYLQQAAGRSGALTCVVRENDLPAQKLRPSMPKEIEWRIVGGTLVRAIAALGLERSRRGELQTPGELDAFYIRISDAEMSVG